MIVTFNRRDFPEAILAPLGIEAQHPDDFLVQLLDAAPGQVCAAVKRQRAALKNPPISIERFLTILAQQQLPETVAKLRQFAEVL